MDTRARPAPPTTILPLPLEGIATQAAWAFEPRARDLEAAYQKHRADFAAEADRNTLERPLEVDAQITIQERLERPANERGPKRRKLPSYEALLATLPRGPLFRGRCRRRGVNFQGAPELAPKELARDVLYALRHRGRDEGGSEWDYQRIHELVLARAATFDWFTAAAFMRGLTPGCPHLLQERLGHHGRPL